MGKNTAFPLFTAEQAGSVSHKVFTRSRGKPPKLGVIGKTVTFTICFNLHHPFFTSC
jgi:hypothetical protein